MYIYIERGVTMEVYNNIRGTTLNQLLRNKKFKSKTPDSTKKIPSLVSPMNVADNYGLRLTTYYVVCYDIFCSFTASFFHLRWREQAPRFVSNHR